VRFPTDSDQQNIPMNMYDSMITTRTESSCPYCHTPLGDRVDADTHIVGCCARWRRESHVDAGVVPGSTPSVVRWTMTEEQVRPVVESSIDLARRVIGRNGVQPAGFRSLPAYEPAA
jgi:hypothetical protein